VAQLLPHELITATVTVPYDRPDLLAIVWNSTEVVHEEHTDTETRFTVRMPPSLRSAFEKGTRRHA
jgi:hypothetical protein